MSWRKTPDDRRKDSVTYGPEWRWARKRQLEADGYRCQLQLDGCTYRATTVDHIYGAAADPQHKHLRAACKNCHDKRTAREQGGGFRSKRDAPADPRPQPRTQW